jgi:hypothetical protein
VYGTSVVSSDYQLDFDILFGLSMIGDKPAKNQHTMKERGRTVAPSKTEKKKAKRKAKLRQEKTRKNLSIQRSQRRFLRDEAVWLREMGDYQDALVAIRHVLRQDPDNDAALREMLIIGQATRNPAVEFAAL